MVHIGVCYKENSGFVCNTINSTMGWVGFLNRIGCLFYKMNVSLSWANSENWIEPNWVEALIGMHVNYSLHILLWELLLTFLFILMFPNSIQYTKNSICLIDQ